eukprot:13493660-Alexandrium_andersonii.AAC.1
MRHCLKRSKRKLRGPEAASKSIPEALDGWVRFAPLFARMPDLPMERAGGRAGGASGGSPGGGGVPSGTPMVTAIIIITSIWSQSWKICGHPCIA